MSQELLGLVTAACDELDLAWHHERDSRYSRGTPGFPDLVITGTWVLWREVKEASRPSRAQLRWLRALTRAGQDARIWSWDDWPDRIMTELRAIARSQESKG